MRHTYIVKIASLGDYRRRKSTGNRDKLLTNFNNHLWRKFVRKQNTKFKKYSCQANVKDLLENLKKIISYLNLDQHIQQEFKGISKKFAFIHIFFNQYSRIMKKVFLIGSKQEDSASEYQKNIRTLSWFLFILQRRKVYI